MLRNQRANLTPEIALEFCKYHIRLLHYHRELKKNRWIDEKIKSNMIPAFFNYEMFK